MGRFIVGVAVSVSAVADVSYLAEVAPQAFRGGMVSMNELAISIGMLASFLTGHVLREVHGKLTGQYFKLVQGTQQCRRANAFSAITAITMLPRYQALHRVLLQYVDRMHRLRWLARCATMRVGGFQFES